MIKIYADIDTGELYELPQSIDNSIITSKKKLEGFRHKKDMWNNPFYWINMNAINELQLPKMIKQDKELNLTMLGGVLILASYINSQDTLICKENRCKTPYTRNEIRNILKMKERSFATFLKTIKRYNIIYQKDGAFWFNQEFIFKGKNHCPSQCVRIYTKGLKAIYKSDNGLDRIGFLLLVVPYLGYDTCCLQDKHGIPIKQSQLGEMLGLSKVTIRKYLDTEFIYKHTNTSVEKRVRLFMKSKSDGKISAVSLVARRNTSEKGTILVAKLEKGFLIDELVG